MGHHGYPRATGDLDVWVEMSQMNAERLVSALREFGFSPPEARPALFLEPGNIIRMGIAPLRIEILTTISGLDFKACVHSRQLAEIEGLLIPVIGLQDLKTNKRAAGRLKDLADLEHLP